MQYGFSGAQSTCTTLTLCSSFISEGMADMVRTDFRATHDALGIAVPTPADQEVIVARPRRVFLAGPDRHEGQAYQEGNRRW